MEPFQLQDTDAWALEPFALLSPGIERLLQERLVSGKDIAFTVTITQTSTVRSCLLRGQAEVT